MVKLYPTGDSDLLASVSGQPVFLDGSTSMSIPSGTTWMRLGARGIISDTAPTPDPPAVDTLAFVTDPVSNSSPLTVTAPLPETIINARSTLFGTTDLYAPIIPEGNISLGLPVFFRGGSADSGQFTWSGNTPLFGYVQAGMILTQTGGILVMAFFDPSTEGTTLLSSPRNSISLSMDSVAIDVTTIESADALTTGANWGSLFRGLAEHSPVFNFDRTDLEYSTSTTYSLSTPLSAHLPINWEDTDFNGAITTYRTARLRFNLARMRWHTVSTSERQSLPVSLRSPDTRVNIASITPAHARTSNREIAISPSTLRHAWAGRGIEIPGSVAPGSIPPGIGAHDYHIAPGISQSGDYLGNASYSRGDSTSITIQEVPAQWVETVWTDTRENGYRGLGRRLGDAPFYADWGGGLASYSWLTPPWPVPMKRTPGTYDIRLTLQG